MKTFKAGLKLLLASCTIHVQSQLPLRSHRTPFLWRRPHINPQETGPYPRMGGVAWNPQLYYHSGVAFDSQKPLNFPSSPSLEIRKSPVQTRPKQRSSMTSYLSSILDPFGLFTSKAEVSWKPGIETQVTRKMGEPSKGSSTTEEPPPMVYFPEGSSGACEDFSPSGFNTYSFLSFLFSVANLVGLIANNVNSNLGNNNNNDRNNNNNIDNINAANSNANQNNDNTVGIPAAMGGRRRRDIEKNTSKYDNSSHLQEVEKVTALVAVDFIRGLRTAVLADDKDCALRNICEVNACAMARGHGSDVIAEVLSQAFVEMYPKKLPTSKSTFLLAGSRGRQNSHCNSYYTKCSDGVWSQVASDFDLDDLVQYFIFLEPKANGDVWKILA